MNKRTKTKEPGIYAVERANGGKSYEVAYRNTAGQRRQKTFRNFNAARDFKRRSHHEVKAGTYVDAADGKITLDDYYLTFKARQLWDQSTIAGTDLAIKDCSFSSVPMGKVRPTHVERWIKELSERLAPSTVGTYFQRVNVVFRAAARDRHIAQSPLESARLPRVQNDEMHIPSAEDVAVILNASEDHWRALWAVCSFAGLRRGEAAALQVRDVRALERRLRVERQVLNLKGGKVRIKAPKHESNRTIYIPEDLVEMLSAHIASGINGEWLFMGRGGNPPRPDAVDYAWRKTLRAADVEHFGIHDLRHFFASGLIASGEDVVKVQRQLGHRSPSITLNVYSHLWPDAEDTTRAAATGLMRRTLKPHVGIELGSESQKAAD
ncbi:tyrosine-type recombinase/integrase [Nesterenkonia natronophila]|uniref:Site-specific integrase n=1 Tax=Nesterenkonia natronophila TaxID=2174932 RepID=A0A3A4FKI8_9MICC|nr:site-specific integrase [Nesterenkonia natronophila]RJN32915.1 site-specific integrase [Nesterenkonia natronophila]